MAAAAGLSAIAVTDHDTVDGIAEARAAAPAGLSVIAGIEISSAYGGREIHLLAYFIDPSDPVLHSFLAPLKEDRELRASRIIERLGRLGIPVTLDEVRAIAMSTGAGERLSLGRPHIADAIVRRGAAVDIDDAFRRYLRRGQPAYVSKPSVPVAEAVRFVHSLGGALVVAHPVLNLPEGQVEALAGEGLDGIEVWHPKQDAGQRARLRRIADRLGLVSTGGSDYHGPNRNRHDLASAGVPMSTVESLRARAHRG